MTATMLSLCDRTGVMCLPWAEAGYDCYAVDVQHPCGASAGPHENITFVGMDVFDLFPDGDMLDDVAFVAAFPPCTDLAGSGARWWDGKERAAREAQGLPDDATPVFDAAVALVERCRDLAVQSGAPWMLEQPVGRLTQRWPAPDHRFHPYEYGGYEGGEDDGYTKRTCLWTGGGFVMPRRKPIPLADDHDRIHKAAPSPERANIRSVTPRGFATAVFEANN